MILPPLDLFSSRAVVSITRKLSDGEGAQGDVIRR